MAATRFVIEETGGNIIETPATPADRQPRSLTAFASGAARWLSCVEFVLLMPSRLVVAIGWLAVPLLVLAIVPVVLLGTLMLLQAPIFFVMWKLFGGEEPSDDACGDRPRGGI
jgi:hypothetical protein